MKITVKTSDKCILNSYGLPIWLWGGQVNGGKPVKLLVLGVLADSADKELVRHLGTCLFPATRICGNSIVSGSHVFFPGGCREHGDKGCSPEESLSAWEDDGGRTAGEPEARPGGKLMPHDGTETPGV